MKEYNKAVQTTIQLFDEKESEEVLKSYETLLGEFRRFFKSLKNDEEFKESMALVTAFKYCMDKHRNKKKY